MSESAATLYWDASAVVSVLVTESHSRASRSRLTDGGTHLLSTLTYAEVNAALGRRVRERRLSAAAMRDLRARLSGEPWHAVDVQPTWQVLDAIAREHPLRGADLWHIATTKVLAQGLPELRILTFDARLRAAAVALGLAA